MDLRDYRRKIIANSPHLATATGAIASFSDGVTGLPLKSLIVNIDPVQDTSGGAPSPTNRCPISGWTGCNVNANGTVIPISWQTEAGTVYRGYLNVITGVLTITYWIADMGTMTWSYNTTYQYPIFSTRPTSAAPTWFDSDRYPDKTEGTITLMSEIYTARPNSPYYTFANNARNMSCAVISTGESSAYGLMVRDSRYSNATTYQYAMNGVMLVYKLETPVEIQLTAIAPIKSLYGQNNISANTGDTAVEYWAHS